MIGFLFSAVINSAEGLGQVTFPLALWEVSCCLNNGLADAIVWLKRRPQVLREKNEKEPCADIVPGNKTPFSGTVSENHSLCVLFPPFILAPWSSRADLATEIIWATNKCTWETPQHLWRTASNRILMRLFTFETHVRFWKTSALVTLCSVTASFTFPWNEGIALFVLKSKIDEEMSSERWCVRHFFLEPI